MIDLLSDQKNRDELIDKLAQSIILAKNTLDKTVAAIDVVQDVLEKSAPLLGEQESIKKLQEILNKVEPGVKTARDVIDKIETLLYQRGDASTIREVLEKLTGSVDNLQGLLSNAKDRVDTLQAILHRVAVVFKALDKAAPLIDKKSKSEVSTARNLLNKVTVIVRKVEAILDKATTGVDVVQSALEKIIALPAQYVEPAPEVEAGKEPQQKIAPPTSEAKTEKETKKEPAPEVPASGDKAEAQKETTKSEDDMLDSLKKANIINPDVHVEDLHKELENLRLNIPEEAGIIGYPGHMLFVWKEEKEEE
ncbi:hypothetical protein [Dictyobacter formicarum]|uniref:hypothetical protein n=1 Tax=Dictyobacter formicarum TaxID=2778368 RepID=UPI0019165841|nr:hypothetical protein [Dictyobacter formicarum]